MNFLMSETIANWLAINHPDVIDVKVNIIESCMDDHPPSLKKWEYYGSSEIGDAWGQLYCDKTTRMTSAFDKLLPIQNTIERRNPNEQESYRKKKLRVYHTSEGKIVHRSYECWVTFKQPSSDDSAHESL